MEVATPPDAAVTGAQAQLDGPPAPGNSCTGRLARRQSLPRHLSMKS
jgi:hypothetical protein